MPSAVSRRLRRVPPALALAAILALAGSMVAAANVALRQVGQDPFGNPTSQHLTEVEPDTFATATSLTIIAAMQAGRFFDGGGAGITFGRTTNAGDSWTFGVLPALTKITNPAGPFDRASDPSVAFDSRHNVWLISSLGLTETPSLKGAAVVVSRSLDGGSTWQSPVTVASATGTADLDKNWTVCDNSTGLPLSGSCYTTWDDFGNNDRLHVAFSRDSGLNWTEGSMPAANGIGAQPLVQPNGTIIMPVVSNASTLQSFKSTDGGAHWSGPVTVTTISHKLDPGGIRSGTMPSAEIDQNGRIFVVWSDCRFRANCSTNDIVMTTTSDGVTWTPVFRVPIDAVTSTVDHFIPGIAVNKQTSGNTAQVELAFYFYPNVTCTPATCQLSVGSVTSTNGGSTWSAMTQLAGPMTLSWLPNTSEGRMVGDYISSSFSRGTAHPVFAVAGAPFSGGNDCAVATPHCNQSMFSPAAGLAASAGVAARSGQSAPVASNSNRTTRPISAR